MKLNITYSGNTRKQIPDPVPIPIEHQHLRDFPYPVIVCDFNKTLADNVGTYPITGKPYPGVKQALQRWSDMGACIHISTGSMQKADPAVFMAQQRILMAFCKQYGLAVGFCGGKVSADLYYDDRMVPVDNNPDWQQISDSTDQVLSKRWSVRNGKFMRNDLSDQGTSIVDYPRTSEVPADQPRGFNGPLLDVDYHGTLSSAEGSTYVAAPEKNAVACINKLYKQGISINLSCAGFSPLIHTPDESKERYNGLRKWAQDNGVLYDRIVTKDAAEVYIDDKGMRYTGDWNGDFTTIQQRVTANYQADRPCK